MGTWYEPYVDPAAWGAAVARLGENWSVAQVEHQVQAFVAQLREVGATLERTRARLMTDTDRANWNAHHRVYARLLAPLLADAQAQRTAVGAVPAAAVVLVIGALALTVWGVAWAVVHLGDAYTESKAIGLWSRELDIRWQAAREGRRLQAPTLPGTVPDPTRPDPLVDLTPGDGGDDKDGGGLTWMLSLLGLGALAGGALVLTKGGRRA